MHLVEMICRTNAVVVVAKRLSLLGRKLQSAGRLRSVQPQMEVYLALYSEQNTALTVCLVFCCSRQGQRILAYFFDVHQLMTLFELGTVFKGIAHTLADFKIAEVNGIKCQ